MLNTSLLNTFPLNDFEDVHASVESDFDAIEFDSFSLQSSSIVSAIITDSSGPSRELSTFKAPRDDGGGYVGDYMRERRITIRGILKADTAAELENKIDEMKRRLLVREGNLDRNLNGNVRRIKATLTNTDTMFSERQGFHITVCPFQLEFVSLEPMWHEIGYTSRTHESVTNLAYSEQIENLGTYKAKAVVIMLIEAASGVTGINFSNNTNEGEIEVTESFAAGDVLVIDSENKSVLLNGVEVDYDGVFPELDYGPNSYTITTTGTSIQYTATIKYRKSYL